MEVSVLTADLLYLLAVTAGDIILLTGGAFLAAAFLYGLAILTVFVIDWR